MRSRKTLVDERMLWTMLGDQHCCWIEIKPDLIEPQPLTLADGRTVQPGDRVTRMGGTKTSAGYTTVDMLPGEWLTYLGTATSIEGTVVLLATREAKSHLVGYWLHTSGGKPWLCHFTPAVAGRMVETTRWEFTTP